MLIFLYILFICIVPLQGKSLVIPCRQVLSNRGLSAPVYLLAVKSQPCYDDDIGFFILLSLYEMAELKWTQSEHVSLKNISSLN